MNNRNSGSSPKRFKAVYTKSKKGIYGENPLIDALRPVMEVQDAIQRLSHFPKYEESMRQDGNSDRYQYLRRCLRFFTPLGVHIDLERRFSSAIRMSYVERNPAKADYMVEVEESAEKFASGWVDPYNIRNDYVSTCAPGFNIVGISGGGKSQTTERILGTYAQVIDHSSYNGQEFTETQIVWLKLDCPFDGSIKALCLNFFQKVDSILGTNYSRTYAGNGSRSANAMIPYIATVAANHHLGILVIDEIQRLNSASSGGRKDMLNFFVQLVNTIGVAVVLIGTFKALDLLNGNFSQMRRGTGEGDLVWDRMSFDKTWDNFVNSLWRYQFTRKKCSLEDHPELSRVLYDECQGITDLAIKAYMFAQERAIETGKETITKGIIRSAAKDKFQIIRPAIEAFRKNDKTAIKKFEDAYPTFLEKYFYSEDSRQDKNPQPSPPPKPEIIGVVASEPEVALMVKKSNSRRETSGSSYKKRGQRSKKPVGGTLPGITGDGSENPGKTVYETLNDSGHIVGDDVLGFGNSNESAGGRI